MLVMQHRNMAIASETRCQGMLNKALLSQKITSVHARLHTRGGLYPRVHGDGICPQTRGASPPSRRWILGKGPASIFQGLDVRDRYSRRGDSENVCYYYIRHLISKSSGRGQLNSRVVCLGCAHDTYIGRCLHGHISGSAKSQVDSKLIFARGRQSIDDTQAVFGS
jgi:hypothetical protein